MASAIDLTDDSTATRWKELEEFALRAGTTKKIKDANGTVSGVSFILIDGAGRNIQQQITINTTQVVLVPASITTEIQARLSPDAAASLIEDIQTLLNHQAQHRSLATQVQQLLPHHVRLYKQCPHEENIVDDIWEIASPLISAPRRGHYKNLRKAAKWSTFPTTQHNSKISLALLVLKAYTVSDFFVMPSQADVDQLRHILITDLHLSPHDQLHGAYDTRVANPMLRAQLAKTKPKRFMGILRSEPFKRTQWIVDGAGQLHLPRSRQEVEQALLLPQVPDDGPPKGADLAVRYRTTKHAGYD